MASNRPFSYRQHSDHGILVADSNLRANGESPTAGFNPGPGLDGRNIPSGA